jgi:uncharacterized membrane protein YhaH (DUF805 family)
MGFGKAVASAFGNYFNFSGRATRPEYWYFVLFMIIASVVAVLIDIFALGYDPAASYGPVNIVVTLATIIPGLSVSIRRLHDIGRSGWWILLGFIPLIGAIVLIVWACQRSESGPNTYGSLQPA